MTDDRKAITRAGRGRTLYMQAGDVTYRVELGSTGYVTVSAQSTNHPDGSLRLIDVIKDQARPGALILRARKPVPD